MNQEYCNIKEPTFNCKDMDARLRGLLIAHMGKPTRYDFSYKVAAALVTRAKDVTPGTVEMLLRCIPDSFPILDRIWHVQPDDIMHRLITNDYWDSDRCNGSIPCFMQDHILIHGEKLLLRYEKSDMVVTNILCRYEHQTLLTSGAQRLGVELSPLACPETYLKYFKRYRNMNKKWREAGSYKDNFINNIGAYIIQHKLDIAAYIPRAKAQEVTNEG